MKKLSNYADYNINETKLTALENSILALFNQANRDFNTELLDESKEYLQGRVTR